MGNFDWLDLNMPEHQQFLLATAEDYAEKLRDVDLTYQKCEEQAAYIDVLEKQVRLLQKTLEVVNKNKVLVRRVRKRGRSPMDKNIH